MKDFNPELNIEDWRLFLISRSIKHEAMLQAILYRQDLERSERTGVDIATVAKDTETLVNSFVEEFAKKHESD